MINLFVTLSQLPRNDIIMGIILVNHADIAEPLLLVRPQP
jgi:hypothetical protein